MKRKYEILFLFSVFLLFKLILVGTAIAPSYSNNYGMSANVFGSGTNKSSANYTLSDVFEEASVGNATSTNYKGFFGFIYTRKISITRGYVKVSLNATKFWWDDGVNVSVSARRSAQEPISNSEVIIKLNSVNKCAGTTNSEGEYSCVFSVPRAIGTYNITAQVTDSLTHLIYTDSTILNVRFEYGDVERGRNVGCYDTPQLIQNPDGSVKIVVVRVCVWE